MIPKTNIKPLTKIIDLERSIFLPMNVPSSKNSKQIGFIYKSASETPGDGWYFRKNGKLKAIQPSLRSSDLTEAYIKAIAPSIIENRQKFLSLVKSLPKPYFLELYFIRDSRRAFDFINATQIIADCITGSFWRNHKTIPHAATQWILDDNVNEVYFVPPATAPFYHVDKDNAGVWITVKPINE